MGYFWTKSDAVWISIFYAPHCRAQSPWSGYASPCWWETMKRPIYEVTLGFGKVLFR